MPGDRLRRVLAVLSDGESTWPAARLCAVGPQIAGVNGAGVMLMSGDIPHGSLCASDAVSQLIEELQYTLGEGPCVDAYQRDAIVSEPDLADPQTSRWSAFTPPVLQAGVRAVFGFPLRVGMVRLGALNLYRDRPGELSAGAACRRPGAGGRDRPLGAGRPGRGAVRAGGHPAGGRRPTSTSPCTTRQE